MYIFSLRFNIILFVYFLLYQHYLDFYQDDILMLIFYTPFKGKKKYKSIAMIYLKRVFIHTFLISSAVEDFGIPNVSYKLFVLVLSSIVQLFIIKIKIKKKIKKRERKRERRKEKESKPQPKYNSKMLILALRSLASLLRKQNIAKRKKSVQQGF